MRNVLLSDRGGDRATAYAMSNKIVSLSEGYLCTWIDSQRQNQWALVDNDSGEIRRRGPLGPARVDNHCGAALALYEGSVHAIIGGHHSAFQHYLLESATANAWRQVASIDVKGTYPSVVSDSEGRLHLAFRVEGERWTLDYCRFENGAWTTARSLAVAEKPGYIYWTNGLAVGPDDSIHLALANTRPLPDGALYHSASHIVSRDGGRAWRSSGGDILSLPARVTDLPLMTEEDSPERVQSREHQERHSEAGPRNKEYQQMLLSNPVVDPTGGIHVVLHNGLSGTADLLSYRSDEWTARPLTGAATGGGKQQRVHMQSSLSLGPGPRLHAALMIEPTVECVWGAPGTYIVRLSMKTDGTEMAVEPVSVSDPSCAQWLPALEHPNRLPLDHVPPLLYTKGLNAGGFDNNKNVRETQVYLRSG